MSPSATELLRESIEDLKNARKHLEYSFNSIQSVNADPESWDESQLERIEAFTSRFGRSVDLLLNKVLRSLDSVELYQAGSLLDVALRAEKRGIVDSSDVLRTMKEMRNHISHDYSGHDIVEIFVFCKTQTAQLNKIIAQVLTYAERRV